MYECLVDAEHLCAIIIYLNSIMFFLLFLAASCFFLLRDEEIASHYERVSSGDSFYGHIYIESQVIFALEKVQSADKTFHHLSIIDDQAGK